MHLDDECILLELPYEVSKETFEYTLASERCKHAAIVNVVPHVVYL